MRFPYSIKGCSHCSNKQDCPIELKRSRDNLIPFRQWHNDEESGYKPRIVKGELKEWYTFCEDYVRER